MTPSSPSVIPLLKNSKCSRPMAISNCRDQSLKVFFASLDNRTTLVSRTQFPRQNQQRQILGCIFQKIISIHALDALVAQLDRVPGYEPGGQEVRILSSAPIFPLRLSIRSQSAYSLVNWRDCASCVKNARGCCAIKQHQHRSSRSNKT